MRALIDRYRPVVASLKASGLRVVDSHVHGADVMNVLGLSSYTQCSGGGRWSLDGSLPCGSEQLERLDLLTRLRYTRLRRWLEGISFALLPKLVVSTIRRGFAHIGVQRVTDEMAVSGVDEVVLLTLPHTSDIDAVFGIYGEHENLSYLGSVDIHAIAPDEVSAEIERQQRVYGIVGIKLHPNLQGFNPRPQDNPDRMAEVLDRVYSAAAEQGLYVLLHAGRTHLLPATLQSAGHSRVPAVARTDCAVLERYCDAAGHSQLFEHYRCRFVLAHLACLGVKRPDWSRLAAMVERYPHVSVDTCGVWSGHIAHAVELLGADRVLFGSDGLYNLQLLELVSCLEGVEKASGTRFEEHAAQILGGNFARMISDLSSE